MKTDIEYMQLALAEARQAAEKGEVPVGALVVLDGKILSSAQNTRETTHSPSAHAEFLAIEAAAEKLHNWRLSNCTVYVTLEPCLMCAGLMLNARIARCVFGAFDPKSGALGSVYDVHNNPALNHAFKITGGILAEESADLLGNFFKKRR